MAKPQKALANRTVSSKTSLFSDGAPPRPPLLPHRPAPSHRPWVRPFGLYAALKLAWRRAPPHPAWAVRRAAGSRRCLGRGSVVWQIPDFHKQINTYKEAVWCGGKSVDPGVGREIRVLALALPGTAWPWASPPTPLKQGLFALPAFTTVIP